jgi:hypothetical protein
MNIESVSSLWRSENPLGQFRSGVCPHGHTMYSEECLSFLPRYLDRVPGASRAIRYYENHPQQPIDFSRAH